MTENQASAAQQTEAVKQQSEADSQLKIARARSDIRSDAEDEHGPSSPHFYSQSVRKSSRSLDSYISDIENSAPDNENDTKFDVASHDDTESDQQVHEQAVRLDLLRRQHSARARQTLEHLQNTAAPSSGSQASESPRRELSDTRRSNSGLSVDMVREQSQQLKQASGDLKRLAEEQRTLAEEAVANFLLQVALHACKHHMEIMYLSTYILSCTCMDHDNPAGMMSDSIVCTMNACASTYCMRLVGCASVQEDMMMGEEEDSEQQEGSQHVGLFLLVLGFTQ